MVRYVRDEELIADVLRTSRRSERNANRPTGTERARTMLVAEQAASGVQDALDDAAAALEEALKAVTTADGKNSIFAGMTEPVADPEIPFAQGDLWYVTDVDGRMTMVRIWNGTTWAGYQFVADSIIVPGSVGPTLIEDGSIVTQKLAADAIDGMVITGATIRTSDSFPRLEMNSSGLSAFDGSGNEVADLSGGPGGLTIGAPGSGDFMYVRSDEISILESGKMYPRSLLSQDTLQLTDGDANSEYRLQLARTDGYVSRTVRSVDPLNPPHSGISYNVSGNQAILSLIRRNQGVEGWGTQANAYIRAYTPPGGVPTSEVSADEGAFRDVWADSLTVETVSLTGSPLAGSLIAEATETDRGTVERATQAEVNAGTDATRYVSPVTLQTLLVQGDRDWDRIDSTALGPAIASLGTGFVHDSDPYYDGLHARIKAGVLYITGRLSRASFAGGAVLFNVATAFRPERPMVQYAYSAGHNFAVAQPDGVTIIALAGTNGSTIGFSWPLE